MAGTIGSKMKNEIEEKKDKILKIREQRLSTANNAGKAASETNNTPATTDKGPKAVVPKLNTA